MFRVWVQVILFLGLVLAANFVNADARFSKFLAQDGLAIAEVWGSPEAWQRYSRQADYTVPLTSLYEGRWQSLPQNWVNLFGKIPEDEIEQMVAACHHGGIWRRVSCALARIQSSSLSTQSWYGPGISLRGATRCASFARAVQMVLERLQIASLRVGLIGSPGSPGAGLHIANVLEFQSPNGEVFSYVVDAGFFSGQIFPLSPAAIGHASLFGAQPPEFLQ